LKRIIAVILIIGLLVLGTAGMAFAGTGGFKIKNQTVGQTAVIINVPIAITGPAISTNVTPVVSTPIAVGVLGGHAKSSSSIRIGDASSVAVSGDAKVVNIPDNIIGQWVGQ